MENLKLIKSIKSLIDVRESHKRRVNTMLDVMDHNKNLSVSPFKVYEPIIKEWLSEINKLNMKIRDMSCNVLDSKESGLEQDEIEEGIYYMTVTIKMQDMLHALEKVNVDSNPSDDRIKKNMTTVDLEIYIQTLKLQYTIFSEKNVDKFEFKNFLI